MIITNKTKNTTLSSTVFKATSLKDKTLGLLDATKPRTLVLSTRFGVHTFGLKRPIDVLILDKDNTVVSLKIELMPNQIFLWNPKYDTVIELPSGTIKKTHTTTNDQIHIKES